MIDGITLSNIPLGAVIDSDILEFKPLGDNRYICNYKGLRLTLNDNVCRLRGSIHKYHNNGKHNYNDFTLTDFIHTLNDLCRTINIEPQTIRLTGFEVGVNIEVNSIDRALNSVLMFNNIEPKRAKGMIEFALSEYRIKMYKKTLKGHKPKLRFELSINKSRKVKSVLSAYLKENNLLGNDYIGCSTLSDLTSSLVWRAFADELLSTFDNILFVDINSINVSKLSKSDNRIITKGLTRGYWAKEWRSRATKSRHLKKFEEVANRNSNSTLKKEIKDQLKDKTKELINAETKPIYGNDFNVLIDNKEKITFIIPTYSKRDKNTNKGVTVSPFGINRNTDKNVTVSPFGKTKNTLKSVTVSPVDKGGKRNIFTASEKVCLITGLSLDIGIRQNDVLSAKGVEYYYNNDRVSYNELLYPRLSKRMKNKPLKKQFSEIAHSLRNQRSNPRNNLKRDLENLEQGVSMMFCYTDMLRSDKKQIYKQEIKEAKGRALIK